MKLATVEINLQKPHVLDFETTRVLCSNLGRIGEGRFDGSQLQARNDSTLFPSHFAPKEAKRLARLRGGLIHLRVVTGRLKDGRFRVCHDIAETGKRSRARFLSSQSTNARLAAKPLTSLLRQTARCWERGQELPRMPHMRWLCHVNDQGIPPGKNMRRRRRFPLRIFDANPGLSVLDENAYQITMTEQESTARLRS